MPSCEYVGRESTAGPDTIADRVVARRIGCVDVSVDLEGQRPFLATPEWAQGGQVHGVGGSWRRRRSPRRSAIRAMATTRTPSVGRR